MIPTAPAKHTNTSVTPEKSPATPNISVNPQKRNCNTKHERDSRKTKENNSSDALVNARLTDTVPSPLRVCFFLVTLLQPGRGVLGFFSEVSWAFTDSNARCMDRRGESFFFSFVKDQPLIQTVGLKLTINCRDQQSARQLTV